MKDSPVRELLSKALTIGATAVVLDINPSGTDEFDRISLDGYNKDLGYLVAAIETAIEKTIGMPVFSKLVEQYRAHVIAATLESTLKSPGIDRDNYEDKGDGWYEHR